MVLTALGLQLPKCPVCGCPIRSDRLEKHLQKVHHSISPESAKRTAGVTKTLATKPPVAKPPVAKPPSFPLFDPTIWGKPSGMDAVLQRLYVVGPYPTEHFFLRVHECLDPLEVLLVVDDGCSSEEVEKIV